MLCFYDGLATKMLSEEKMVKIAADEMELVNERRNYVKKCIDIKLKA